jgi:UTP--glucose-1-phosphate uridylyltransferase
VKVTKALVLAAGFGTRMLPATKVVPKEMLPIVDRPVIEYIVEELIDSGIEHVIIVTAAGKRAVEDHFGRVADLELLLESKKDLERLERIRKTWQSVDISFVRQHEMGGIAHAVLTAKRAIGNEPFVLVLPDDLIVSDPPATAQLMGVFDRYRASVVCVERVPKERTSSYGIIDGSAVDGNVFKVAGLVEKPPDPETAPSDLAIVGRYIFTSSIFEAIARTKAGTGGELQITDAMNKLIDNEPLYAVAVDGRRYDTGQPLGYIEAGIELGLRRPEYRARLLDYLASLVESDLYRSEIPNFAKEQQ